MKPEVEFSDCMCLSIRKASRNITQAYNDEFKGLGINITQFSVLAILAGTGKQTITKVAHQLGSESSASPSSQPSGSRYSSAHCMTSKLSSITRPSESTSTGTVALGDAASSSAGLFLSSTSLSITSVPAVASAILARMA